MPHTAQWAHVDSRHEVDGDENDSSTQYSIEHKSHSSKIASTTTLEAKHKNADSLQRTTSTESTQGDLSFPASWLFVLRTWWKEWALVLFAIGNIIAIAVVLRLFNQQPQPDWSLGLNLNTIIAVLSTLLRSSLVTVVEEVISQAKWSWQHRPRPAQHLAHFDEASRGPLGALLLCFRIPGLLRWKPFSSRHSSSAVIACWVTVLSLAVGAFTQQAIKSTPCTRPVPGTNASIPVARYAHPFLNESEFNWSSWDFDAATKARIVGAFGSPNSTRPTFLQGCTTGNCTFESLNGITHVTSGFCSRCEETTNFLVKESDVPNYFEGVNYPIKHVVRLSTSPSLMLALGLDHATRLGLAVNVDSNPLQALSGSMPSNASVAINIASVTRAACSPGSKCSGLWPQRNSSKPDDWTEWGDVDVVAVSCGLYPCARHMRAEASNGRFSETIVREELYTELPDGSLFPNGTGFEPYSFFAPCWENNTRYDKQPTNMPLSTDQNGHVVQLPPCAYGVSLEFLSQLYSFVSSFANGNCSAYLDFPLDTVDCRSGLVTPDNTYCTSGSTADSPLCTMDYWWLQNLYNSGNATFESISTVMENLALAITDSARVQPYPGVSLIPGTIWESTVCTDFSWPWICFPAALVALTAFSLVSIASPTVNRKDEPPIWKSSILPLIYGRIARPDGSVTMNSMKEIEDNARDDILIVEKGGERWECRLIKRGGKGMSKTY